MLNKLKNVIVPLFFAGVLAIGLGIYKDYGFSYDEQVSRGNGVISAIYMNAKLHHVFLSKESIENKIKQFRQENGKAQDSIASLKSNNMDENALLTYEDRDYGPFFEIILVGVESALKQTDTQTIYQTRHLLTFLQFFVGLICFYLLLVKIFSNWKTAIVGTLFLVLSPRIFGQSFYNSKDIVLLSYMIIGFYTLSLFLEKRTLKYALIHGVICAIAVDIRIIGVLMCGVTGIAIFAEWLVEKGEGMPLVTSIKPFVLITTCFVITFLIFMVLFWPFLWSDPMGHFMFALNNIRQFRWTGPVNYMGHVYSVPRQHLPWHYLLVWIAISTPLLYVGLAILGVGKLIFKPSITLFKSTLRYRLKIFAAVLFGLPVFVVIVLKPVIYSDWRHFYFVYPFFIIIALIGLTALYEFLVKWIPKPNTAKYIIATIVVVNSCVISFGMVENHPYQFVYFNQLVSRKLPISFELDYWGLSYGSGYKYILANDTSSELRVAVDAYPGVQNLKLLSAVSRKRVKLVAANEAQYLLTGTVNSSSLGKGDFKLINTIMAYGMPILYIYKTQ